MIAFLDRLNRAESEADREQFLRGVLGLDKKVRPGAFIVGWLSASLISKTVTERKRK